MPLPTPEGPEMTTGRRSGGRTGSAAESVLVEDHGVFKSKAERHTGSHCVDETRSKNGVDETDWAHGGHSGARARAVKC